tara:strand:- start:2765 stop:3604 length:840 start_codon:yes stop_codon:yes gene_type:complete
MPQLNGSIVLYKNDPKQIKQVIDSFFNTKLKVKLYLIDNSPNDYLRHLSFGDNRIKYIYCNSNFGYGAGHNKAIRKTIIEKTKYHLVLNPDIYFESDVLSKAYRYMESNPNIGNLMPKVLYPDGRLQYLCKLLPTPFDLVQRRFNPIKKLCRKRNHKFELRFCSYNKIMNVPSLSGCFMFIKAKALEEIGLFDENFFMYMEDFDLNRRMHLKYQTIFYPDISITHEFAKSSYKQPKNLIFHIRSAIHYFNKWGWFLDKERELINQKCLESLDYKDDIFA